MLYTGGPNDVCPITLKPVTDLDLPVCFAENAGQAYECEDVVQWLKQGNGTNPLTGAPLAARRIDVILQPLVFEHEGNCNDEEEGGQGTAERVRLTQSLLRNAGYIIPVQTSFNLRPLFELIVIQTIAVSAKLLLCPSWDTTITVVVWLLACLFMQRHFPLTGKLVLAADLFSMTCPLVVFYGHPGWEFVMLIGIKLRVTGLFITMLFFHTYNEMFHYSYRIK